MCYRHETTDVLTSKLKFVGQVLCKCQHTVRLRFLFCYLGMDKHLEITQEVVHLDNNNVPGDLNENNYKTHRSYFHGMTLTSEFPRIY